MADFLQYLRQQNIFGSPPMIGNDLPSQGGITGRMPLPPGPNTMMDVFGAADPTQFMPPPQFDAETDYLANLNQPVFGGPAGMDVTQPPTGLDIEQYKQTPEEMDAGRRMRELYQPDTDATERFERMIDQYPEQKRPGVWQGIGSLLQEFAYGPRVAEATRSRWRDEPIEDWKNKIGPMQQAATIERYENVNRRTAAYNQISAELREKAQIAKEKNDTRNAEIRQQRADVYAFKATHPNWKIMMPKGGNIIAINPMTGESHDTGIPTGSMTDLDRINLQGEQRLDQIAATGEQARETETTRQAGRMEAITARGEQARQTRATPPGGVAGRPVAPTQIKVDQYNKARQIVNSSPALGRFIKLGQGNEFTVVKPGERGGPTPQQYSDIINNIYGSSTQGGRGAGPGPGPRQPTGTPPKAPAGWKYVPKPGGGWTAVKDTQEQF